MTALIGMTLEQLANGCRQIKSDNSHEPYCFELFRRAIIDKSELCWSALYAQYSKLVVHWVDAFRKSSAPHLTTPIEDLVMDAFTAFWRAFTVEKLSNAGHLAQVLSYLKSCSATAVLQAKRREEHQVKHHMWDQATTEAALDGQRNGNHPEEQYLATMWQEKLWQVVNRCCYDERERVLARLSFVSDLKPSEILDRHPELFADVAEIYTLRRNLKNRLWRDKDLQELWGESIS